MVRGNSSLQEGFAQRDVTSATEVTFPPNTNGHGHGHGFPKVNVIQGLLDLALSASTNQAFDVRISACECIKAYLYGHAPIRLHFLRRAREGHLSGEHEDDNILTILIHDTKGNRSADPYRQWIAAVILFHILYENYEAKNLAMDIAEGDATNGEEVVTCIQALSSNLISGTQRGDDKRATIGYLMVISGWLFEDPDAVNDFLGEGSNVQGLIHLVLQNSEQSTLIAGLCAFLLGIIYEFSTKDSPISRLTLHQILTSRLGREQFTEKMTRLREHPMVRDFEVLPQGMITDHSGRLPEVYFDKTFMNFLKDNFSRIVRAIERDPGMEVPVIANGIQKGVSRELVDMLKAQLDDRSQALQKAESDIITVERKLGQEQADHRKAKESAVIEFNRIKAINEGLQRNHEEDLNMIQEKYRLARLEAQQVYDRTIISLEADIQRLKDDNESTAARTRSRYEAEIDDLKSTIRKLETELHKSNRDHVEDLQTAHEEYSSNTNALESRLERAEEKASDAEARMQSALSALDEKEKARCSLQAELDDLLMVLGDLEEKRTRDKVRSLTHGQDGQVHYKLTWTGTPEIAWRTRIRCRRRR